MKTETSPFHLLACICLYLFVSSTLLISCKKHDALQPEPGEQKSVQLSKIAYSSNHSYSFDYTQEKKLLQTITLQRQYMQDETPVTQKVVTSYTYNEAGLLVLSETQGMHIKYFYKDKVLSRTEEYDHQERLVITRHYAFDNKNKLTQIDDVIIDPFENNKITAEFKKTFEYNSEGNLILLSDYIKRDNGIYDIRRLTYFDGFDTKKFVEPELNPYLLGIQMFVNNPLSQTVKDENGTWLQPLETYTYEYNPAGYPVRKTITYTGGIKPGSSIVEYSYIE